MCQTCSKLTIEKPEQSQWLPIDNFVNFDAPVDFYVFGHKWSWSV